MEPDVDFALESILDDVEVEKTLLDPTHRVHRAPIIEFKVGFDGGFFLLPNTLEDGRVGQGEEIRPMFRMYCAKEVALRIREKDPHIYLKVIFYLLPFTRCIGNLEITIM